MFIISTYISFYKRRVSFLNLVGYKTILGLLITQDRIYMYVKCYFTSFFYVSLCMLVSRLRYSFFLAMLVIYRSLHTLSNRKITILLFWFTSLKSIKLLYNKLNKFAVYDTWLVCTPNRAATEEPKEVLTFFS